MLAHPAILWGSRSISTLCDTTVQAAVVPRKKTFTAGLAPLSVTI
jgi:hypothetical protein